MVQLIHKFLYVEKLLQIEKELQLKVSQSGNDVGFGKPLMEVQLGPKLPMAFPLSSK